MNINVTKAGARATIRKLLAVHNQVLADIANGKRMYRGGEDKTDDVKRYVEQEIKMCQQVDDAIDYMNAGDIKRAAALCDQIKEFLV